MVSNCIPRFWLTLIIYNCLLLFSNAANNINNNTIDSRISSSNSTTSKLRVNPIPGSVWPKPQAQVTESTFAVLNPANFEIKVLVNNSAISCPILDQAVVRYKDVVAKLLSGCQPLDYDYNDRNVDKEDATNSIPRVNIPKGRNNNVHPRSRNSVINNEVWFEDDLTLLTIKVRSKCEDWPTPDMDERYVLQVHTPDLLGQAELVSYSVWGALKGLETFVQLLRIVEPETTTKTPPQPGQFTTPTATSTNLVINTTSIIDFPRFSYRGLLIDTSRHFIPVRVLLENLELMSQNKLNVFHWHIVDDQSFPYQSVLFPQLSQNGAYNPKTHIYTQKDIAFIIDFARQRGIRVIPEFDSPGHTLSWGKGVDNILTPCYNGTTKTGTYGPMNPTVNSTYKFLEQFFTEIAHVFPDSFLHLGGDEVDFSCWKTNPDILQFMDQQGFAGDFDKLESYYVQKLVNMAQTTLNKQTVVWQEVFDNKVRLDNQTTVVHVWKGGDYQSELTNVTNAGFKTILSACWYLDYISYGVDWHKYYQCEPLDFNGTSAQKKLVVGGAAAMWNEFMDGTGLTPRIWPRASTVAERLWSDQKVNDVNEAAPRLEEHRCRMMKRGLRVEPPNGPGFCECDYI